jgi:hypothetical protein
MTLFLEEERQAWPQSNSGAGGHVTIAARMTDGRWRGLAPCSPSRKFSRRTGTVKLLLRGMAVWCCVILVEVFHGIARTVLLERFVGDFRARQIAVFTGSLLMLAVAALFIRWIRPTRVGDAVAVGGLLVDPDAGV